jgi:hypothetical protein
MQGGSTQTEAQDAVSSETTLLSRQVDVLRQGRLLTAQTQTCPRTVDRIVDGRRNPTRLCLISPNRDLGDL